MTAARRRLLLSGSLLAITLATACGDPRTPPPERITVFAAASLTGVFTDLGERFEQLHPGTEVVFTFAGSTDLAAQVQQGAAADVIATADEPTMATMAAAGLLADPARVFASNRMTVAVPPDNPAGIRGVADLERPGVTVVVCAPQVPCGAATESVERAAGITLDPASEETSVSGVVGKVTAGEADAGIVYVTDVVAAGSGLLGVPIPRAVNATNRYPIGVLGSPDAASTGPTPGADRARQFTELVTGPTGRRALRQAGFGPP